VHRLVLVHAAVEGQPRSVRVDPHWFSAGGSPGPQIAAEPLGLMTAVRRILQKKASCRVLWAFAKDSCEL
jgi:hypothetical protein